MSIKYKEEHILQLLDMHCGQEYAHQARLTPSFRLFSRIWIQIQPSAEYGSNLDPDPDQDLLFFPFLSPDLDPLTQIESGPETLASFLYKFSSLGSLKPQVTYKFRDRLCYMSALSRWVLW